MKNEKYNITGMTCAACQANITRHVQKLEGVEKVDVNLLSNSMTVSYDDAKTNPEAIIKVVTDIGYGATKAGTEKNDGSNFSSQWNTRKKLAEDERRSMKRRLISSIILLIPLMYVAMGSMLSLPMPSFLVGMENMLISALTQLIITIPILIINKKFFVSGFKALVKRAPNMDSLVAVGSGAALIYGIISLYFMAYGFGHGDMDIVHKYGHELYFESSAMILTLVTVGKYLESRSKSKTSDALGKLIDLAPKTATVIRDGHEITIPAQQVAAGDIVVIRPGESIPVDGVITEGYGYLDQAAITGESIPVEKNIGDTVISATINKNGTFKFKASRVGDDTTLAQIIRLVDEAGSSKAPIARLADKISGIFVPIVMAISLITLIVWLIAGSGAEFAISCAISVLVISCPCALGLATPVAIMVGTGKAAEYGILIKSAESLENLHSIDTIVLDKTGTITSGRPSVTDIIVLEPSLDETKFLKLAAALESGSEHPLAAAVIEKANLSGIAPLAAVDFISHAGRGVSAVIDGKKYFAGNMAFMSENNVTSNDTIDSTTEQLAQGGKTPLFFADSQSIIGIIAVADTVRPSSESAIAKFHQMGLKVVMLTGDNKTTAEAIRAQLQIEEVISDVLPTEKEACIRHLQDDGRRVAMVGDGINDAPALTRADIGIAIGAGTDIAIDSADVVLMKDSLLDVVTAIELSKSVIRNIRMNLFWAFFYNILGIPVAAGVLYPAFMIKLNPMIGSAAMSLSSVCVVLNALRLRFFKNKYAQLSESESVGSKLPDTKNTAVKEITGGTNTMKKTLKIDGMMCAHCQAHVQKALESVDGVSHVEVSLENKSAVVTLTKEVDNKVLCDAVTEAGYTPISCE